MNHVRVQAAESFRAEASKIPSAARKEKSGEAVWRFEENGAQIRGTLSFPQGSLPVECELPPFVGGFGAAPDPVQYCLWGMAACYAATFALAASLEGVTLTKLNVRTEAALNMAKYVGAGGGRVVERLRFTATAEGAAPEVLEKIKRLADERCPAVECVRDPPPFATALAIGK